TPFALSAGIMPQVSCAAPGRATVVAGRPRDSAWPAGRRRLAQDLFHGLAPGQFVDQLVQVTDLLHQRLLDVLHPNSADQPLDQAGMRIQRGRLVEEGLEVVAGFDLLLKSLGGVSRQPAYDLIDLVPG